jgi:formylglycine-generating enzyme required for sulfatase activity
MGGAAGEPGCDGADCNGPPSCVEGLECQGVDCCESIVVPGGSFKMGRCGNTYNATTCTDGHNGLSDETPEHIVTVSSFALDAFEVTVGRFRAFVEDYSGPPAAGAGANPHIAGSGWNSDWNASMPATKAGLIDNVACDETFQTWTDEPGELEDTAITCVTWFEAFAFCIWDGGRLPTEAEWEYAAVGGNENRLYPWGSQAVWSNAYASDVYSDTSFSSTGDINNSVHGLPVGSHPLGNGKWGHRDLAGSQFEWTFDWYKSDWYSTGGATCNDCANLTPGTHRVPRGGGYRFDDQSLKPTQRGKDVPNARLAWLGVRCARTP